MSRGETDNRPFVVRLIEDRMSDIAVVFAIVMLGLLMVVPACQKRPQIVVNMGTDATQPGKLPDLPAGAQVLAGDRAALWYTIFVKAMEKTSPEYARYYANDAVKAVYGEAHP